MALKLRAKRESVSPDDLLKTATLCRAFGEEYHEKKLEEAYIFPAVRKAGGVVAFDPKTKAFQSWPIPSGGGVVRNMVATRDDRLYLACSGVNKVAIAEVSH